MCRRPAAHPGAPDILEVELSYAVWLRGWPRPTSFCAQYLLPRANPIAAAATSTRITTNAKTDLSFT